MTAALKVVAHGEAVCNFDAFCDENASQNFFG